MKKLFLLFNHTLTAAQEADARASLEVEKIVPMPQDIQGIWSQVPADLEELTMHLRPIFAWLGAEADYGDFVLIQGDFGAAYLVVQLAIEAEYVPVYSTTERRAEEEHLGDGTVKMSHAFRHVRFRRYGR